MKDNTLVNQIKQMNDKQLKEFMLSEERYQLLEQRYKAHEVVTALATRLKDCNYYKWKSVVSQFFSGIPEEYDWLKLSFLEISPDFIDGVNVIQKQYQSRVKILYRNRSREHIKTMERMASHNAITYHFRLTPRMRVRKCIINSLKKVKYNQKSLKAFSHGLESSLRENPKCITYQLIIAYPDEFLQNNQVIKCIVSLCHSISQGDGHRNLILLRDFIKFKVVSFKKDVHLVFELIKIFPMVLRYSKTWLLNGCSNLNSQESKRFALTFFEQVIMAITNKSIKKCNIKDIENIAKNEYFHDFMRNPYHHRAPEGLVDVFKEILKMNGLMLGILANKCVRNHEALWKIALRQNKQAISFIEQDQEVSGDFLNEIKQCINQNNLGSIESAAWVSLDSPIKTGRKRARGANTSSNKAAKRQRRHGAKAVGNAKCGESLTSKLSLFRPGKMKKRSANPLPNTFNLAEFRDMTGLNI